VSLKTLCLNVYSFTCYQTVIRGVVVKVALINPQTDVPEMREIYNVHENLGLGLIAAYLQKWGYDVDLYDMRAQQLNEAGMAKVVCSNSYDVVGLSCNYATLPSAVKVAQLIKFSGNRDAFIAFGGEHVSYMDNEILNTYRSVGCIVRGEGEVTFRELVSALE